MKKAIIIRGPAASGKSTVARILGKKLSKTVHIDVDYFKHLVSKDSSNQRSRIAHDLSLYFVRRLSKHNYNIVIEEIFRKPFHDRMTRLLKRQGYVVKSVFLSAPSNKLLERDKKRSKTKGRKVVVALQKEIAPLKGDIVILSTNTPQSVVSSILKVI